MRLENLFCLSLLLAQHRRCQRYGRLPKLACLGVVPGPDER
jgi:hypothetical protein